MNSCDKISAVRRNWNQASRSRAIRKMIITPHSARTIRARVSAEPKPHLPEALDRCVVYSAGIQTNSFPLVTIGARQRIPIDKQETAGSVAVKAGALNVTLINYQEHGRTGWRSRSGKSACVNRFHQLPDHVSAVSEANRRDSFGWLGPQEFAFDTLIPERGV